MVSFKTDVLASVLLHTQHIVTLCIVIDGPSMPWGRNKNVAPIFEFSMFSCCHNMVSEGGSELI